MNLNHAMISICAAGLFLACGLYVISVPRDEILDDNLKEQLNSSVPLEGSTDSLRTAFEKIAIQKYPSIPVSYSSSRKDTDALTSRVYSNNETGDASKYFDNIIKDPQTLELYRRSQKLMGATPEGQGAARWITLGVVMSSSTEYGSALHIALKEANSNPNAVLGRIKNTVTEFRKDPFIYQMAINIVYQLSLNPIQIGRFFGEELEHQLENLSSQPTDSFWVSSLGLLLSKQSGVNAEVLEPYIQAGFKKSKGPANILADLKKSIQFHYPAIKI